MSIYQVERLAKAHERAEFACGKPPLDTFLHTLVSQYERRRLGRTYVAVVASEKRVRGYYTLASGAIAFANLPATASRKLPPHPVPVVLLARLAVDLSARGQGLGGLLLMDAFKRCRTLSESVGVHAVAVDAIDEEAVAFYQHYGFIPLLNSPRHLYLPLATIEAAFPDVVAD